MRIHVPSNSNSGFRERPFVGWGTLSLINAGLAQAKGRSGSLWWIASLFFGPVATFLIVILDPVRRDFVK